MDRDKLIGQAADYYLSHPNADFAVTMADFHIAMSAERDAEIADKLESMPFVWGKEMRDFIAELHRRD